MSDSFFDQIIDTIFLQDKNVFLTGGAGTGKSFICKKIIDYAKSKKISVVVTASTGKAAVNIQGVSLHSFFKFAISQNLDELKLRDKKQNLKELNKILAKTELIVIDEISMVSADLMDMIYFRLKNSKSKAKLLIVGDFYQLPPIQKNTQNLIFNSKFAFESSSWEKLNLVNFMLIKSKRTNDEHFYELLSKIRLGICDENVREFLKSRLVEDLPDDIIALFGKNIDVDKLNQIRLNEIDSEVFTSYAISTKFDPNLSEQSYNKWIQSINLPLELNLKIGAKVMFVVNKWGEFYNGEQGIISDLYYKDDVLVAVVEKENYRQIEVLPYNYELSEYILSDDEIKQELRATFSQLPLRLAYAITIHKSQGMSLSKFSCDLNNIFAKGQLYVALSRAISPDSLNLIFSKNIKFDKYLKDQICSDKIVDGFYANTDFIKETQ